MRSTNSIINLIIGISSQLILLAFTFVVRKVFIDSLGIEYLGINGLMSNIISMLSLTELGLGTAIIYSLFKPLANNDKPTVIALMQIYAKLYRIIALVVTVLSIAILPLISILLKESSNIENFYLIYFIFIFNTVSTYFFSYKISLLNADQKAYIVSGYNLIFKMILSVIKIVILITIPNFILYLIVESITNLISNYVISRVVDKRYGYFNTKQKYLLDENLKNKLKTDVKALFLHNLGGFFVFGTDNILIAAFLSISIVGIYSNYNMILNIINGLCATVVSSTSSSFGNLIVIEDKNKIYDLFKSLNLLSFWIYAVCAICLLNLLSPFIAVWLGHEYLLSNFAVMVIVINFFISGMRVPIGIIRNASGIFSPDKYAPIIESIINLIGSILLVKYYGIVGIFLGTLLSSLLIPFWIPPMLIFHRVFKKSLVEYFKEYLYFVLILIITAAVTSFTCSYLFPQHTLFTIICRLFISLLVPNILFVVVFYRKNEFKYLINLAKAVLGKAKIIINKKASQLGI